MQLGCDLSDVIAHARVREGTTVANAKPVALSFAGVLAEYQPAHDLSASWLWLWILSVTAADSCAAKFSAGDVLLLVAVLQ